jgi:transcriptional regulator with XRE-family HTH domain
MFKFTPEMGLRLRELRLREGMTQQELAVLMGRQGKGNHQLVGKVELGKAPYPSLGFVADYLRACKASFADIADLLNAYTSQPTVIEQRGCERVRSLAGKLPGSVSKAVMRYDHGVTRSKPKPEPVRERLKHAKAYGRAQAAQLRLETFVAGELAKANIDSASADAVRLRVYARRLWGLLRRVKDKRKLKHGLENLERWTTEAGLDTLSVLSELRGRIAELSGRPFSPD